MARPTKTQEPLTEIIPFRLSKSERAKLNELAEQEGLAVADLVRVHLMKAKPRKSRTALPERLALIRALGELGKIGSNINQLAKAKNAGRNVQYGEMQRALREVEQCGAVIRAELMPGTLATEKENDLPS